MYIGTFYGSGNDIFALRNKKEFIVHPVMDDLQFI